MVFEALPISAKKHAPKARGEIGERKPFTLIITQSFFVAFDCGMDLV